MTYKEKLMQERPECVSASYGGGCFGCPDRYGYEAYSDCYENEADDCMTCTECWSREMSEGGEQR